MIFFLKRYIVLGNCKGNEWVYFVFNFTPRDVVVYQRLSQDEATFPAKVSLAIFELSRWCLPTKFPIDSANDNSFFCGFRARFLLTGYAFFFPIVRSSVPSLVIHFRCEKWVSVVQLIVSLIAGQLLSFCPLICHTRRFNLGRASECTWE